MVRTLIAEPSAALRSWIRSGLGRTAGQVTEVETGWEILWHLSEEPCDLVVANARLPDVPGPAVLAMVRSVGLDVPFALILPFCSDAVAGIVARTAPAAVVADWTDTVALRAICRGLLGQPDPEQVRFSHREAVQKGNRHHVTSHDHHVHVRSRRDRRDRRHGMQLQEEDRRPLHRRPRSGGQEGE